MDGQDKKIHLFMVTHVLPYPPAAGNEIRIFKMLQWLKSSAYRVSLVIHPLPDERVSKECLDGLNALADDVFVFDAKHDGPHLEDNIFRADKAEQYLHLREMQDGFCQNWFVKEVDDLIRRLQPDVVISEYIFMSRILLLDSVLPLLKIIDTHDLFCKKRETVEKYAIENFGLMMSEADEAMLFQRADVLLAIQQSEQKVIAGMVPDRTVLLTGFDLDTFRPDRKRQMPGVVLVVASSNEFNVRGTQDFLDFIWPLVRRSYPEAQLRIIGKVCNYVHTYDASVKLLGFVNDLSKEYEEASVVVNPCGVGTGLKIKTVEALSWGKAHVGWPASADGLIEFDRTLPYVVAKDAVEFSEAITKFLDDPVCADSYGSTASVFVEKYFGAEATYGPLAKTIKKFLMKELTDFKN